MLSRDVVEEASLSRVYEVSVGVKSKEQCQCQYSRNLAIPTTAARSSLSLPLIPVQQPDLAREASSGH